MKTIKIIFLNGVGSVGKTSIAKSLQSILNEPYLLVGVDHFIDMLPEKFINHADGILFEPSVMNDRPITKIQLGPVGEQLMNGMHHAIAALAEQGNNLIIDEVLIGDELNKYQALLKPFTVFYIGIYAPLAIIEKREHLRSDRLIGLARWQYDLVHKDKTYDLEIDTTESSPEQCAERIKNKLDL